MLINQYWDLGPQTKIHVQTSLVKLNLRPENLTNDIHDRQRVLIIIQNNAEDPLGRTRVSAEPHGSGAGLHVRLLTQQQSECEKRPLAPSNGKYPPCSLPGEEDG